MSDVSTAPSRDYSKSLYLGPFIIFALLMWLRNSGSFDYLYDWLPVLGRTLPHFCLTLMLVGVFKYRGGQLADIGLCWPPLQKNKLKTLGWIVLWAMVILVARILVAVVLSPVLESFSSVSRKSELEGNLGLLLTLLPCMWLVVMGEEVLMRGLLMNYLAKLCGDTTKAWLVAVVISAIVFGLAHSGKGLGAVISSGCGGLVYGMGYYLLRKNLWPVFVAHCAGNTIGFVGAYFND